MLISMLDEKSQAQVMKSQEAVKSIAKTIHFLAKQNLPLGGHRDYSQYLKTEGINLRNFQELLQF